MSHIPVLLKEVIEYLAPQANQNFIDATSGTGGHSLALLEKTAPEGKLLAIEWNKDLLEKLTLKIKNLGLENRFIGYLGNFKDIDQIVKEVGFSPIDGALYDLGLNTELLENSGRGFSYKRDEPLDMRYGETDLTARDIVNEWSEEELKAILINYGEERKAKAIAREIVKARKIEKIETTAQLVSIILKATRSSPSEKHHPARKTFQALRIATNNELENLWQAIPKTVSLLKAGARLVIISYHSLEDRIVKQTFLKLKNEGKAHILTKKPITPTPQEIKTNPRARSAKLRAITILNP